MGNAELIDAPPRDSAFRIPHSAFPWSLLVDQTGRSGSENMACDWSLVELAARTGAAFLRLYRWDPPCLSFGRNEPASTRYDRAAIERRGLDVVRRPTGGRAVWHEHEVTYAVAAPIAAFGSLRAAYCAIHERLAAALRHLGLDPTVAPTGPTVRPSDLGSCFDAPAGGEVLVGGRKVVGSAQVRHGTALLQHGSILLGGTQGMLAAVSCQPSAVSEATSLSEALGRPVAFAEMADAVIAAWHAPLTPTAPDRPRPPLSARFSDPDWTWRR